MMLQRAPQNVEARQYTRALRRAFTLMEILIVVAIIVILAGLGGYYLLPQLDKGSAQLCRRDWRPRLTRAADARRHRRLFDVTVAAFGTRDFAGLLLRLVSLAVAEPTFELMARSTAQREPDHRHDLLETQIYITRRTHLAIMRR